MLAHESAAKLAGERASRMVVSLVVLMVVTMVAVLVAEMDGGKVASLAALKDVVKVVLTVDKLGKQKELLLVDTKETRMAG